MKTHHSSALLVSGAGWWEGCGPSRSTAHSLSLSSCTLATPETSGRQILVASYTEGVQNCIWIESGRGQGDWWPKPKESPESRAVLWNREWGASEPPTNRWACCSQRETKGLKKTPKPDQKRARYEGTEAKSYSWSLWFYLLNIQWQTSRER